MHLPYKPLGTKDILFRKVNITKQIVLSLIEPTFFGRSRYLICIIFFLQSEVMSAGFAKFHPNLVVGGTYSGQIVLWDNRSNKRTPVQRTPLSAAAHTVMHWSSLTHTQHFVSFFSLHLYIWLTCCLTSLHCVQHPVYCVNVVGTQNANNLISISTDGKMCSWSLDMLSQPQVH